MSKPANTESASAPAGFVRRTHTAGSLTVREAQIASYLIAKLYKSPVPEGAHIDRKSVGTAFGVVGQFVTAIFEEASKRRTGLQARAKKGDDAAVKELKQIDAALAEMEKQKKNGDWDRIQDLAKAAVVKERAPRKSTTKPAAAAAAASTKPATKKPATKKAAAGGRPEGDGKGASARKPSKAERKVARAQAAQAAAAVCNASAPAADPPAGPAAA